MYEFVSFRFAISFHDKFIGFFIINALKSEKLQKNLYNSNLTFNLKKLQN